MTWKNTNGQQQVERPIRVRLADGLTRTNEEVTDQLLANTGWTWHPDLAEVVSVSTSTESTGVV